MSKGCKNGWADYNIFLLKNVHNLTMACKNNCSSVSAIILSEVNTQNTQVYCAY